MGAEEGKGQNQGSSEEKKDDKKTNKKDKKKKKKKEKSGSDEDDEEESEESDDSEESEESDDSSEENKSDKKDKKDNKDKKDESSKKVSEEEKEIKQQLDTIPKKSEEDSESKSESISKTESSKKSKLKSNSDADKSKEKSENKKNEDSSEKKEEKEKEEKDSSDLSSPSSSKKSEKKTEEKLSEEKIIEPNIENKSNNKKKKVLKKNYKNVLPNEIPEERRVSKATKLSFGYKCCQTIEDAHEKEITTLAYILKRNEIATGSVDQTIKIWKVNYKKGEISLYKELTGHSNSITCVKDFPKLNCFCSASSDNTLKLWDTSSLKCLKTLKFHTKCVLTCCYNPSGKKEIFSGGEDLDIIVWTTEKDIEKYEEKKCLKGHTKRISSLAYADDYNYLLSGSDDKTLRIWDLKNIEDIQCIKVIKDLMSPIDLLLYLENRLLVGCEDGMISFIKMNKMKRCRSVRFSNSPIYSFYIFHKHRYLIIGCKDGKTRVWKIGTNKREVLIGHTDAVTGVCDFEDDYIVTTSIDKSIKLWKKV
jgi:WD40 repeat protein